FLLKKRLFEFKPIDVSKMLNVTNKTVINRCAKLTTHGFLIPNIVKERVRSYSLSEFAKANTETICSKINN
ncbi:MAG: Fic family protein, partial [Clostridia bacterium]|nr:Fic family protein [Clostridia bacterium]